MLGPGLLGSTKGKLGSIKVGPSTLVLVLGTPMLRPRSIEASLRLQRPHLGPPRLCLNPSS